MTDPVASIFSPGFRKKRHGVSKFSTSLSLLSRRCFALFKHTQAIYAVKVAPGKPQTGLVKLKISPGIGDAKFSLNEEKKSAGSGSTGSVTEGCFCRMV